MQIFLKTMYGKTVTLDVEGSDTYEDVVTKINNYLDNIDPLITKNPRIIIDGKELLPGGHCHDIGVLLESEGHIMERTGVKNLREPGEWVNKLSQDRKSLYTKYSRKAEYEDHKRRMEANADLDFGGRGGGRKKRKTRRTRRKGSKRKGSKRKGSKRRRKSRRTRKR
jgi:ubiquitin-large subunit ribosomal protein L40e